MLYKKKTSVIIYQILSYVVTIKFNYLIEKSKKESGNKKKKKEKSW